MKLLNSIYGLLLILFITPFIIGQNDSEPNNFVKNYKELLQHKYFSLNLAVQFRNQNFLPPDGESFKFQGFETQRIRTKISGELTDNISYLYHIDYAKTVKLMDIRMSYKFSPEFIVDIGQFKVSYSREWLVPLTQLNYSDRARIVNLFSPKRQIGLQFRGQLNSFGYMVGYFNGNGTNTSPDSRASLLTARIAVDPFSNFLKTNQSAFNIGLNGAYSDNKGDKFVVIPGYGSDFSRQIVGGIDFNFKYDFLQLSGEYHKGWLQFQDEEINPWGAFFDLTMATSKVLNLSLRCDLLKEKNNSDLSTLGQVGLIYKLNEISLIRASLFKDLNESKNPLLDRMELQLQFAI